MMIKGIIFDQDGILFDSEPVHYRALVKLFQTMNRSYPLDLHEKFFGYNAYSFFTTMKETLQLEQNVDTLMQKAKENMKDFEAEINPFSYARDLLTHLQAKEIKMGLATGTYRSLTMKNLERNDFLPFFKEITCGDEVQEGKPHPEIYLTTCQKLQLAPPNCLVLEDAPAGIQSAKAGGMTVIAVKSAHNKNANLSQADYLVKDLMEAQCIILDWINS